MVGGGGGTVNTVAGRLRVGTPSDLGFVGVPGSVDVGLSTLESLSNTIDGFVRTTPSTGFAPSGSAVLFYQQDGMNMNVIRTVNMPETISRFMGDDADGNYLFYPSSANAASTTIYRINKQTYAVDIFATTTTENPDCVVNGHIYTTSGGNIVEYVEGNWNTVYEGNAYGGIGGGNYPYVFLCTTGINVNYKVWKLYNVETAKLMETYSTTSSEGTMATSGNPICFDGNVVRPFASTSSYTSPPCVYADGTIPKFNRIAYGTNVEVNISTDKLYLINANGTEYIIAEGSNIPRKPIVRLTVDSTTADFGTQPLSVKGTIFA